MSALSEREAIIQEVIRLKIANRLMDEELKRLQPDLVKYGNSVHPAARPIQRETVSTLSLAEKTMGIKQEASMLTVVENDLIALNDNVSSLFNDVEMKVSQRDALFSEIEHATSQMNYLAINGSQYKEDSDNVRDNVSNESNRMVSMAYGFQERIMEKMSALAVLQKTHSDWDSAIKIKQQRINALEARKAEFASKIDMDSLERLRAQLRELTDKTAKLNDYIAAVTKDEGQRLESLTTSITECETLKKKKAELIDELGKLDGRREKSALEIEEHKKQVDISQNKLNELTKKKEMLSKEHEIVMAKLKERYDPLFESLRVKKEVSEKDLDRVQMRIKNREECMMLRKELESMGKIEPVNLTGEIDSLKREIEYTRTNIVKTIGDSEYYRVVAARVTAEAEALHASERRRRLIEERNLHQKDGIASHYEIEVLNLKKKLVRERMERENRLAHETRRLLEKAKEEKERKEKEERRRIGKEKEEKRRIEKEKIRKVKEGEEKKLKKLKEENEKKKDQSKIGIFDAIGKKNVPAAIVSQVNQRRMNMEAAASIPFASNDGSLLKPPMVHSVSSGINLRSHSIPRKSMFIFDDDSSEDDDDDMNDFLLDESARVMPRVPEKYAGSPPRVEKQSTLNPFELSFTDVQSSTPIRNHKNPSLALEVSFNHVVTSTPQISRGSKTNKKQTRPRGKKRSK